MQVTTLFQVPFGMQREPDIGIANRSKMKVAGQNADDCRGVIVQRNRLADHISVAAKILLPPHVAEDRRSRSRKLVLARLKIAADQRGNAKGWKKVIRDHGRRN